MIGSLGAGSTWKRNLALVCAVAAALRIYPWLLPHTFLGVLQYDDGIYYAASKALLHGLIPYRDFTILHPPLTSVLLLPFALIGALIGDSWGLALARIMIVGVSLANLILVYRLSWQLNNRSRSAALMAAAIYAVCPDTVIAEHTVLLEPLVNLCCLVAVSLLLRERDCRPFLAGIALAAGMGIKLFAAAYVIGILVWLPLSGRRVQLRALIAGLATGGALFILPFFALAPSAFWHDVVVTQFRRPIAGWSGGLVVQLDRIFPHLLSMTVIVALIAAILCWAAVTQRLRPGSAASLWILVGGISLLAFATSASYFQHYGDFLAPAAAVALGAISLRSRLGSVAAILVAVIFVAITIPEDVKQTGQGDLRQAGARIPPGSCVFYEAISLPIAADVLTLPSTSCPSWIDGRGVSLTWNTNWPTGKQFYPNGFRADTRWQAETISQLSHATFLLLIHSPQGEPDWSAATRKYAADNFSEIWAAQGDYDFQLWKRNRG